VRPLAAAAQRLAAAGLVALALALAGCGESEEGRLAWSGTPRVERSPTLPEDTVLTGTVRNAGDEPLELRAEDVEVLGAGGRALRSSAAFLSGYVYSHVPYNRGRDEVPSALPRREQERLGRVVRIEPDATAPLTVSWRGRADRIEYGDGSLTVRP
jgi:hypothetical protein